MIETPTKSSRWQASDGYPTDDYFTAVENALETADVSIAGAWRDELWDYTIRLDETTRPDTDVYIGWAIDEHCDPLSETGFTGHGWMWLTVDSEDRNQRMTGDFAVDALAEPEQVAAEVTRMLKDGPR